MNTVDNLPDLATPSEVAKHLRLDRQFIMSELREGKIAHYRPSPKRFLIKKEDVMEYLEGCRKETMELTSSTGKTETAGKLSNTYQEGSNVTLLASVAVSMQKKNLLR